MEPLHFHIYHYTTAGNKLFFSPGKRVGDSAALSREENDNTHGFWGARKSKGERSCKWHFHANMRVLRTLPGNQPAFPLTRTQTGKQR